MVFSAVVYGGGWGRGGQGGYQPWVPLVKEWRRGRWERGAKLAAAAVLCATISQGAKLPSYAFDSPIQIPIPLHTSCLKKVPILSIGFVQSGTTQGLSPQSS